MKPITDLTSGHVGKTIHVTDDSMDITGTLNNLKVNVKIYHYRAVRCLEMVTLRVDRTYEIEFRLSGHTIRPTLNAQWEECDE